MNESLTPQELLYMYLDGECTPEQVAILFEAMAIDSELQKEFDEAVAFQQTLDEDKSKSVVPFSVTNSIFQRIGASIIPSSEIASTATVATTQTVSTSVLQAIWSFITNNSLVVGISALLTLVTGIESSKNVPAYKPTSSSQAVAPTTTQNKEGSSPLQNNNGTDSEVMQSKENTPSITNESIPVQKKITSNRVVQFEKKKLPEFADQYTLPIIETNDNQSLIPSVQIFPSLRNEYKEDDRLIIESLQQIPIKNSSRMFQLLVNEPLSLSIQLRSMNSIVNLPSRSSTESFTQNFGTTVLIALNKNHSIGLEISQETFPHFALETQRIQNFTTAPLFTAKETIMWTGASYQYSFDPIQSFGDVQPFVRTTAGASAIGGVSKTILGVQVPITNSVFSTVGFEGSLFFINNVSSINASQKLSVTYSLGWNIR
ncbi:MAG: hypothetical protein JNL36_10780 [Candidatus Kapabacteria bacterium]|nr:hypothetical protein [Candidatus Kapabacteria bacterium]